MLSSSSLQPNSHHKRLFQTQLQSLVSHISKPYLTFQQLYLIYYESNIKFINQQQQNKIKQLFQQKQTLTLRDCISLVELHSCQIIHNRPIFHVIVSSKVTHDDKVCFQFWKGVMKKKYGSTMRWFDLIAGQLQTRKIKCYDFKRRIKEILKDTIHQVCADSICLKFPKNVKNQIQWGTFMAVARYRPDKYKKSDHNLTVQDCDLQKISLQKDQKIQLNTPKNNQTLNSFQRYRHSQRSKSRIKTALAKQYQNEDQNHFNMKSSIQISRQFEQVIQKFRNCNRFSQLRAHSAKWVKIKDKTINKTMESTETNWRDSKSNKKSNIKTPTNLGIIKIDYWQNFHSKIVDKNKLKTKQSTSFTSNS